MKEKNLVVLINGSPKPNKNESTSEFLINMQERCIKADGIDIYRINARESLIKDKTKDDFDAMNQADAVILTFPLYIFCLPGLLTQYLQDYYQYWLKNHADMKHVKLYVVVNCGFSEFDINEEAVRIIQSFSRQIGADFRFGVLIGAGGMLTGSINAPFMKKTKALLNNAFSQIKQEILNNESKVSGNINIPLAIPRKLYYFFADKSWLDYARKNNLKKRDLYKKPYYNS